MANQQNFITGQLNGVLPLVGVKSSSTGLPIVNAFIHIKYAETEPTQDTDIQDTPNIWIGIYAGTGPIAPTNFEAYTWQRIKGLTGERGYSAYEVWINEGNAGDESNYFAYLKQEALEAAQNANNTERLVAANEFLRENAETGRDSAEGLRQTAETNRIALHSKWSNPEAIATTLAPESPATAEVVIGADKVAFNLGLPEGIQGEQGLSAYEVWEQQPENAGKTEQEFVVFTRGASTAEAEAARDAAEGFADAAQGYAAQLAAGVGSPKGAYADLAALNTANPDHDFNYITLDDGHWAYYDTGTSAFVDSGYAYLATDAVIFVESLTEDGQAWEV